VQRAHLVSSLLSEEGPDICRLQVGICSRALQVRSLRGRLSRGRGTGNAASVRRRRIRGTCSASAVQGSERASDTRRRGSRALDNGAQTQCLPVQRHPTQGRAAAALSGAPAAAGLGATGDLVARTLAAGVGAGTEGPPPPLEPAAARTACAPAVQQARPRWQRNRSPSVCEHASGSGMRLRGSHHRHEPQARPVEQAGCAETHWPASAKQAPESVAPNDGKQDST
jgi:hypothetical protein